MAIRSWALRACGPGGLDMPSSSRGRSSGQVVFRFFPPRPVTRRSISCWRLSAGPTDVSRGWSPSCLCRAQHDPIRIRPWAEARGVAGTGHPIGLLGIDVFRRGCGRTDRRCSKCQKTSHGACDNPISRTSRSYGIVSFRRTRRKFLSHDIWTKGEDYYPLALWRGNQARPTDQIRRHCRVYPRQSFRLIEACHVSCLGPSAWSFPDV